MPDGTTPNYYDTVDDLKIELVKDFRAMALNDLGLGLLAHLTARMPGPTPIGPTRSVNRLRRYA